MQALQAVRAVEDWDDVCIFVCVSLPFTCWRDLRCGHCLFRGANQYCYRSPSWLCGLSRGSIALCWSKSCLHCFQLVSFVVCVGQRAPRLGGPTPFDVAVPVLMCTWTGRSERCLSAPRPRRCLFGSPLAQCLAAEANALFRFVSHALSIPSDFSPILSLFFPPLFFK